MIREIKRAQGLAVAMALSACTSGVQVPPGNRALDSNCGTQNLTLASMAAPGNLATTDVNGDGVLDLLIPNGINVSVLLGDGNGSFGAETTFGSTTETAQLAVGDVNGDQIADLVSADGYDFGTLSIQLGNGDGTFQSPTTLPAGGGFGPIAIADLNGDGIADIAFADASDDNGAQLLIFLGTGGGQFGAPLSTPFNPDSSTDHADSAIAMAIGDLNNDNVVDLVIGNTVFLGAGDGTFAPQDYAGGGVNGIALADLDGDGQLDIAATTVTGDATDQVLEATVYYGNGDGSVTVGPQVTFPAGALQAQLVAGDVNGDGILDLLTGGSSVEVTLGQGNRTFGTPQAEFSTTPPALSVAIFPITGNGPGIVGASQGSLTVLDCP